MLIRKVIRYYFLFVMGIVSLTSFAYVGSNHKYFGSVFSIQDDFVIESNDVFELLSDHSDLGTFKIMRVGGTFVTPGQTDFKIAEIIIEGKSASVALKDFALKPVSANPNFIDNIRLVGGGVSLNGVRKDGSFEFDEMDYLVDAGKKTQFDVLVDISNDVTPGTRAYVDIEKPSDLFILADGRPYSVYSYFPVKIKHLTAGALR